MEDDGMVNAKLGLEHSSVQDAGRGRVDSADRVVQKWT
jgi:hypothetical protein